MKKIPFHKLYKSEECLRKIDKDKLEQGFYKEALSYFFQKEGFKNPLLTDSCTRALEIAAFCLNLSENDEVILPTYSYVSTVDIFAKRGCKLVFADSETWHPNVCISTYKKLVSERTKVIVAVHYGGYSTNIEIIREFCDEKNIILIEDNAHSIGAKYHEKTLGTFGHFSATSFHETKNIHCFSGGLLAINDDCFKEKALRYYNKGTDRHLFEKGHVAYYQWVSHGNSCDMSAINQGFLFEQLHLLKEVNGRKMEIWHRYNQAFLGKSWNFIANGMLHDSAQHNAHIYPICFANKNEFLGARKKLAEAEISAYGHYHSLNMSQFGLRFGHYMTPNADRFSEFLIRLPIYPSLTNSEIDYIISVLNTI